MTQRLYHSSHCHTPPCCIWSQITVWLGASASVPHKYPWATSRSESLIKLKSDAKDWVLQSSLPLVKCWILGSVILVLRTRATLFKDVLPPCSVWASATAIIQSDVERALQFPPSPPPAECVFCTTARTEHNCFGHQYC